MEFVPFQKQKEFLLCDSRIKAALSGRRGGKTEIGAIQSVIYAETRPGWKENEIDPYIIVIIAPTTDMLRRISLKKFLAYSKPFNPSIHKTHNEITWHNGALIYGISADKPERLEGIKANVIWVDEILQCREQIFLESLARTADTQGKVFCTGSLGVQYTNPKNHWVYKHFIEKPMDGSKVFTWATADNPYFPREEIERQRNNLDKRTFEALFELNWDVQGTNLVYDEFTNDNVKPCKYNPSFETYVSVDWGFAHRMSCLYIQYDPQNDTVYVIDEIGGSKITLEQLYAQMRQKPYRIKEYYCDIAGNQEREQSGYSNVAWFRQAPRNIHFKYRTMSIAHTISIVRSYIKNTKGQRRLYVDPSVRLLLDGLRNYSYKQKDGTIDSELPLKDNSDEVDALRYFLGNRLDFAKPRDTYETFSRWKVVGK